MVPYSAYMDNWIFFSQWYIFHIGNPKGFLWIQWFVYLSLRFICMLFVLYQRSNYYFPTIPTVSSNAMSNSKSKTSKVITHCRSWPTVLYVCTICIKSFSKFSMYNIDGNEIFIEPKYTFNTFPRGLKSNPQIGLCILFFLLEFI